MQVSELDVFKDVPGYKAILKTVLRSQIQMLVCTLSVNSHTQGFRFFYKLIYKPSYCNFPEKGKKNSKEFFLFYPLTLNIICFVEKKYF